MPEPRTRRPTRGNSSTGAPRRRTARAAPETEPRTRRRAARRAEPEDVEPEDVEPEEEDEPEEEPEQDEPEEEPEQDGPEEEPEQDGPEEEDEFEEDEEGGGSGSSGRARIDAAEAARRAAVQVQAMTGRSPEGVTAVERTEDGWRIGIEVVESRRIPDSTDILALYRVDLGQDGDLLAYRRESRYHRGRFPEEEEQ
ncbi:gas vesicle protein GvpO [Kitasatospora phosalacinea]|uniref:gas vesicle protein GvpO n=1 Tax=Kitasatospora phosalacinea TaxID=2065 RepID=UPI0035D699EC